MSCAEEPVRYSTYPHEAALLRADALGLGLAAAHHRVALPLSRAAAAWVRLEAWGVFGYARLEDAARERFSRSGTWVRQLAQVGEAVGRLEGLGAALTGEDGGRPLGTEKTRAIGQVGNAGSVGAWVELGRRVGVRELRREVLAAQAAGSAWPAGEAPPDGEGACDGKVAPGRAEPSVVEGAEERELELVRLLVPVEVAAAFDEALELYRAVVGGDSTVTSFVEALVADALGGADPPDLDETAGRVALNHGESRELTERALEHSTESWSHLPQTSDPQWAFELAGASLRRFAQLSSRAGEGDAVELDSRMRGLLELQDELERRLGELLVEMGQMGAWSRLRFKDVEHYAVRRLGLSPTGARERVRVARGVRRYPVLRQAYETRRVGLSASLAVVRILQEREAVEAVQSAWAGHAEHSTVKRMRDEARALRRLRVMGEGGAAGREAADGGPPLPMTDAAWRESLRREAGTARERVARLGEMAAAGVEKSARCGVSADVFLRLRLPAGVAADFFSTLEASRRALARHVAQVPWDRPWPGHSPPGSVRAAREFFIRCRKVPLWAGLLLRLEEFVATCDVEDPHHRSRHRAVHERAGYRCEAAGCTSRCRLQAHHLEYRSRGGGEEPANKATLCAWHHLKGEHGVLARFFGRAPLGVYCRLGRRDVGRWFLNERRIDPGPI